MRPGDPHTRVIRESAEPPGACMTVHACSAVVEQDRADRSGADGAVDSPPDRWRQRDQDHLAAFAADSQHPMTMLFAEITDICAADFGAPQAQEAQHGHQGEVVAVGGFAGGCKQGLELQVGEPEGG